MSITWPITLRSHWSIARCQTDGTCHKPKAKTYRCTDLVMYRSCTEIDLRMYRNWSCTESVLMYRNGPLSKNYVPQWYVPKVSCTDMDLPRRPNLTLILTLLYFMAIVLNRSFCISTVRESNFANTWCDLSKYSAASFSKLCQFAMQFAHFLSNK